MTDEEKYIEEQREKRGCDSTDEDGTDSRGEVNSYYPCKICTCKKCALYAQEYRQTR